MMLLYTYFASGNLHSIYVECTGFEARQVCLYMFCIHIYRAIGELPYFNNISTQIQEYILMMVQYF